MRRLYKIGEVARRVGLSRQALHNYTVMGLLKERARTAGGHRLYDESVFRRLELITQVKRDQVYTLREMRRTFFKDR